MTQLFSVAQRLSQCWVSIQLTPGRIGRKSAFRHLSVCSLLWPCTALWIKLYRSLWYERAASKHGNRYCTYIYRSTFVIISHRLRTDRAKRHSPIEKYWCQHVKIDCVPWSLPRRKKANLDLGETGEFSQRRIYDDQNTFDLLRVASEVLGEYTFVLVYMDVFARFSGHPGVSEFSRSHFIVFYKLWIPKWRSNHNDIA